MKHSVLVMLVSLIFLVSCSSSDDLFSPAPESADWVDDAIANLTESVTDPVGDFEVSSSGAPPYSAPVEFSPADVTQVSYGLDDDYLYLQLNFAGTIPQAPLGLDPSGEIEEQTVLSQTFHLAMDTDNSDATGGMGHGVTGVDLDFGVRAYYGEGLQIVASHGLPAGEVTLQDGQILGEIGAGGPGQNYVLARFDLSAVAPQVLPRGTTVEVGGWSEAESDLYSDLTSDPLVSTSWAVPYASAPGSGGGLDRKVALGAR